MGLQRARAHGPRHRAAAHPGRRSAPPPPPTTADAAPDLGRFSTSHRRDWRGERRDWRGDQRARPLVRADRRPPRRGLPALLVHQGHRPGGRLPGRALGLEPGDAGARRRLRPGPPRPRAGRAGHRGRTASTSASGSSTWPAAATPPARRHLRAARRPGPAVRRRVRRRHLAVPGRLRPDRARRRSTTTAPCSTAWPGPCGPAAGWRCQRVHAYFQVRYLEATPTFDAASRA